MRGRDRECIVDHTVVDGEECAKQGIFWLPPISWGAETGITPRPRPLRCRINFGPRKCFLIAHEGTMGCSRSINALFPASFPEDRIATEEREMDTCIPCSLHVRPLFC